MMLFYNVICIIGGVAYMAWTFSGWIIQGGKRRA